MNFDDTVIKFKNVSLTRNGNLILRSITTELRHKRIGIIGNNGSGKSSFVRLMNGLLSTDNGEIVVHGLNAKNNKNALITDLIDESDYSNNSIQSSPLNKFDCPPISDGSSAMIIASEKKAYEFTDQPIWIEGIDHRIESSNLGSRDLSSSDSLKASINQLQLNNIKVDVAELHTQFSHELPFLKSLLNLTDFPTNLSGGPLIGNVMMCAGLDAIGKTYESLKENQFNHGLAHATSGPCLQHNMLVHLEKQK